MTLQIPIPEQLPTLKHTHAHLKQEEMKCMMQFRWRGCQSTGTHFELVRSELLDIKSSRRDLFQGQNAEITS